MYHYARLRKTLIALHPLVEIVVVPLLLAICIFVLWPLSLYKRQKPRILLGCEPLINIKYWAQSFRDAGYEAKTCVFSYYHINRREDFDIVFMPWLRPQLLRVFLAYCVLLPRYDIVMMSFNGLMGQGKFPVFAALEPWIFKILGKKTIVYPYGSDAYVYRNIRDISAQHALQISYPQAARQQVAIQRRVDRWTKHADIIMPGFMAIDGIGRWDLCIPNFLVIDDRQWIKRERTHTENAPIVVAHSPNHRGAKGTEFLLKAIENLQSEGLPVSLLLIENRSNEEVLHILTEKADILVEQLIFPGHGLSAIEGMASGLPVISNLSNNDYTTHYRRYAFFDECPLVSATPETITDTLRELICNATLRQLLGDASRAYVEKYHSYRFGAYVFGQITRKLWYNDTIDLMGLFHPLTSEYIRQFPRIQHPLKNNRIVH